MKNLLTASVLCTILLFSGTGITIIKPVTIVVKQPDAPLKIITCHAAYEPGGRFSKERIGCSVEYQNVSGRKIVAFRIGLVCFNVFSEFLGRTAAIAIEDTEPNMTKNRKWQIEKHAYHSFHTGVAYVATVRFENGEIWSADLDAVREESKKIDKNFDVSKIEAKWPE